MKILRGGIISGVYYKSNREENMDLHVLRTLEYHKICAMLAERAGSAMGKEKVEELVPVSDMAVVRVRLQETTEARDIMDASLHIPLGGIRDVRSFVNRAEVGGILEPHEMMAVSGILYAARRVKKFFDELALAAPLLESYVEAISVLSRLENVIELTIDEHGNIRDDASVELARLRREIKNSQHRVKEKLDGILRSSDYQKYFQDTLVTMRGDRYVIPIKQEYRHNFPGIVHDQSASGATVFIEPMAIVSLNNDIKQLISAEKNEVERILQAVSAQIAKAAPQIIINAEMLAQLDFAFAKAKLSIDMNASLPQLNQNGYVNLRKARHPLIPKDTVVPIDLFIGREFNTLLITGPNTGGKTVSLKTLGLFVLMTQAGLYIPADGGSEIALFANVFADIGDEQSIEQSLSTFSAHMTNLVRVLNNVSGKDLVLIDEIGAGTDPDEGAALATAILEHLIEIGARTVATTHYSELKSFAYLRREVENASVEFNIRTLRPTYRLLIGIPGSSNAFAISGRLGLRQEIIAAAKLHLNKEHAEFETVLRNLEEEKMAYIKRNEELAKQEHELAIVRNKFNKEQLEWNAGKERNLARSREEAAGIVRQARRDAEETIKELKAQFNVSQASERQKIIDRSRQRLTSAISGLYSSESEGQTEFVPVNRSGLKPGMTVHVSTLKQTGIVLKIGEQDILVQLGAMKMTVPLAVCSLAQGHNTAKPERQRQAEVNLMKSTQVARQIDIRGVTVEEAEMELSKYLDDAVLAGLNEVLIIHGKGTGALRKGVREYLCNHHHVKDIGIAEFNEGGAGATVVRLL
jgi:DNA mismatch repair protein MutS2